MKSIRSVLVFPLLAVSLVACGGDSSTTTEPVVNSAAVDVETSLAGPVLEDPTTTVSDAVAKIRVTVGVDSGPDRVEYIKLNQQVELTIVNPNADDEFHVHGYDLGGGETKAGEDKTFVFAATEAGDFEVESHISETVMVVLRVS